MHNIPLAYVSWAYHMAKTNGLDSEDIRSLEGAVVVLAIQAVIFNLVEMGNRREGEVHSLLIFPLLPASAPCYIIFRMIKYCIKKKER